MIFMADFKKSRKNGFCFCRSFCALSVLTLITDSLHTIGWYYRFSPHNCKQSFNSATHACMIDHNTHTTIFLCDVLISIYCFPSFYSSSIRAQPMRPPRQILKNTKEEEEGEKEAAVEKKSPTLTDNKIE